MLNRVDQVARIAGPDREIGCQGGGSRVAGSGKQVSRGQLAVERPAERVLAATPTHHQHLHFFCWALRNASRAASAAFFAASVTRVRASRNSPA